MTPELRAALIDWAKSAYPNEGAVFNHLILVVDKEFPPESAKRIPCSNPNHKKAGPHWHEGPIMRGMKWQ